jgi:hypothetical protein
VPAPAWPETVLLSVLALSSSACAYHTYSPPARGLPLESAATLPKGRTALSASGGMLGTAFGPDLLAFSGQVRHGFKEGFDGVAAATVLNVRGDSDSHEHPNAYALRAGAKLRPLPHLAFTGGLGGGGSAQGGFVSPDLGTVLAFENHYLVPWLAAHGFISQPIGAQRVYLGVDTDPDPDVKRFGKPRTSIGGTLSAGLRIPLQHHTEAPHSILLGISWAVIADSEDHEDFLGLAAGFEYVLPE